ncbi:MAG TPA: hypothetical protein VGS58_15530 [Candidatus Sulfopaludibacter sp.]|nr:hypothetical protein [Candidatus Sulfopaludibacter sp.]
MQLWRTLVRHFFTGFDANVTQTLGLLAVPGAFFVLVFQPLLFRDWDLVGVRYLFISLSMILMGIVVVVKWDALFPDRRDYVILTPLPVPLGILFSAKAAALAILLAIFLVDANFFSTFFWPGIDGGTGALSILGAHIAATVAAGVFSALAMVTLQGVLLLLFSGRMLRRVSALAQTLLMTVLVMLFFLSPLLGMHVRDLAHRPGTLAYWFPGYWFVGFYERLRPATGNAALLHLGHVAVRALGCVSALFAIVYLAGYRRHAQRVLETPEPSAAGVARRGLERAIDRLLLRGPVERAVFHFIGQTIVRSVRHRLFLAVYAGFGASLAVLSYGGEQAGLLRLPFTLSFILVSGLRAAFNFPCELGANWMFRVSESNWTRECASATRKWVLGCGIVPLFLLFAPMELSSFRWPAALFHLAFGIALSAFLSELLFAGFRKVPFTCSYLPGKVNVVGLSALYIFGFTLYSRTMASIEEWLVGSPAAALGFFAVAAVAWMAVVRRPEEKAPIEFEDTGEPAVRTLEIEA